MESSVNMPWPLPSIAAWWLGRPPAFRILLLVATAIFLVELSLRRFAPESRLYARWKRTFEAVGAVWTAVLLTVVYVVSVGPVGLGLRLVGSDPLDRRLTPEPSYWRPREPGSLSPEAAARHQF